MTYPTSPLGALDADGAFEIGGGDYLFGQDYNETIIRSMFKVATPTPANALSLLEEYLFKFPLEVLQTFKGLIPGAIDDMFIDTATSVATIMGSLVDSAFNILATAVQQIFEIVNGLIVTPINTAVGWFKSWWNFLTGQTRFLTGDGELPAATDAQATADAANVGLGQLAAQIAGTGAGGGYYSDTFAYPASSTMSADYDVTYSSGTTGLGTDGNNAVLSPPLVGTLKAYARVLPFTFANDYQGASFVQDKKVTSIITPPEYYIFLRANAAMTHFLYARVNYNACAIYKVVAGTHTQLASTSKANGPGDLWDFKAGTATDVRHLRLFKNNNSTPVLDVTDTAGTLSSIGSSNLYGGFGAATGTAFVPPIFTTTTPSFPMQSFSLYDRLSTN